MPGSFPDRLGAVQVPRDLSVTPHPALSGRLPTGKRGESRGRSFPLPLPQEPTTQNYRDVLSQHLLAPGSYSPAKHSAPDLTHSACLSERTGPASGCQPRLYVPTCQFPSLNEVVSHIRGQAACRWQGLGAFSSLVTHCHLPTLSTSLLDHVALDSPRLPDLCVSWLCGSGQTASPPCALGFGVFVLISTMDVNSIYISGP